MALSLSLTGLATAAFGNPQARLATYETAAGQTSFALSLTPGIEGDSDAACNVVVLFDTSASQTGAYRDDGLSALSTLLGSLSADDRVKLVAVDLEAVELTPEFTAPQSQEIEAAIAALEQRAPLGATDMGKALKCAIDSFAGSATSPRCAVYIGDGMSKANYLDQNEFAALMKEMVNRQVAFSSYVIGPQRDIPLVAAIANSTGGMMYVDTKDIHGPQAGDALSQYVHNVVVWPKSVTLPKSMGEVFPRQVPPLRSDRDTILVGTLNQSGAFEIAMTADVQGKSQNLTWRVSAERPNIDFAFLPQLIESARIDDGMSLPTIGTAGLLEARRVVLASARDLSKLSRQALVSGNEDGAQKLAEAALRSDPENTEALRIRNALQNEEILQKQDATGAPDDLTLVNGAPGGPRGGSLLDEFEAEEGRFLDLVEQEKAIYSEKIEAEVEEGLKAARDRMGVDSDGAVADLKILLETVDRAIDLDVEKRSQLRNQIESAIREASRRAVEEGERRTLAEQNRAAAIERQRLVEATARDEIKIGQLMERFNSLMKEGRYREAEDDLAAQIRELAPDNPVSESILHNARFVSNMSMMFYHREMRHKKFVDTLHQVELSHIPFPDEPPIVYPPAEVWHELTMKRLKYRAVDLAQRGGAEEKIFAALDETTKIDFIEVPLQDVVDYLADLHKIPIVIDTRALDTVGLGSDTPITRRLEGISLRSALKLLLKELELTYVIDDEVLQITTQEEANANLITKVYPVGDLVVPIQSTQVNPFQQGGGLTGGGGQGGFGNNQGNNQGGGFGGGLGGGGLGGGVFAVEDDLSLDAKTERPGNPVTSEAATAQRIVVNAKAGESPAQAWDRYFSENEPAPAAVRETVRSMTGEAKRAFARGDRTAANAKFDELIELIHAALRRGQPQPWMYEALAIAMQASGRPQAEIERALMSAIDFSDNMDDVMWAAAYMARLEFDERALQLFRDVASANPSRPEPYIQGLASAKRLDDIDGIRWACVGILQRAWQKVDAKVEDEAFRTVQATLLRLRHENRLEEAEQFDADVSQALVRDLVIRVSWSGDADIDILVEEPSGSVCSLRNARTTSGGVLQGDAWAVQGKQPLEGYAETYTCPQAFAGQYRIYLRRIWGSPTAGKVTVEFGTGMRTDSQKVSKEYIDFGSKGAVVLFDLKNGRRQELLPEQEVANVAKTQVAFNRAVLSQQLSMLENSEATRRYATDQVVAAGDGRLGRGGVGFRPVVQNLPSGTNQTMSGIISADRRYVRINSTPLFSSIDFDPVTDVFTFAQ